ncbi:MAG: EF-hand domain-containing protein [Proteobacteria bacterium]|nr:EF-hand domain-containing protein [Pseudomonadota bacterium]
MRNWLLAAIGLAAMTGACGLAQAQNNSPPGAPDSPRDRGGFFMRADANNDGVVTRQEFESFRTTEFARLDANHDGQLSQDEFRAGRRWGGPGGPGQSRGDRQEDRMARLDANHDGNISREEFLVPANAAFDRLDANHDGMISAQERQGLRGMRQGFAGHAVGRHNLDTNGDGAISRAEWDAATAAMFERMDANHDGRITRDEAEAARPRRGW